jgi:hypothetical protein
MKCRRLSSQPWVPIALAIALGLLASGTSAERFSAFEIGVAEREAGHLRGLTEKLAKQNVLYQLHLGAVSKSDMEETVTEIDRLIETLERGSAAYSIAPPTTMAIREQLREVDRHWSALRHMSLASPYDYLRHSSDLVPRESPMGDPLRMRSFDRRCRSVIAEAEKLMLLYKSECEKAEGQFCEASAQSGVFNMHIERVAKNMVLMYAGLDIETNRKEAAGNRDLLDKGIGGLGDNIVLKQAIDPARGKRAAFVASLWGSIQEGWDRLRFDADLATEGRIDGLDIPRMLNAQRELVDDFNRIRGVLTRFAQAQLET